ncbi:MAG: hypothetical protein LWW74_04275 [Burkholderiales bacterium]|nr:hypothetical protein [Burkholderiales bacterium]
MGLSYKNLDNIDSFVWARTVMLHGKLSHYENGAWKEVRIFGEISPPFEGRVVKLFEPINSDDNIYMYDYTFNDRDFGGVKEKMYMAQLFNFKPINYGLYKAEVEVLNVNEKFSHISTYLSVELRHRSK